MSKKTFMDFQKKLENFDQFNYSKLFYDFGYSPENIKEEIIEDFENYFEDKEKLHQYATSHLVTIWHSYISIQSDFSSYLTSISAILKIYNSAKHKKPMETFSAYAQWLPDISQSITRFWSMYFGQKNFEELDDEEFFFEILQVIGQSIEGIAKPFLQLTLFLNRITRSKNVEISEIKNKDLGVIIDELINTSYLIEILAINNIRLNQWRNISYHHNSKFVNGKMLYSLRRNNKTEDFEITRDELGRVFRTIQNILKIFRIAETIFVIDNLDKIQMSVENSDTNDINFRKESKLIDLYNAINSQGFNVTNLIYDESSAKMQLTDLERYSDFTKKAIHSSQFLYYLWVFTGSKVLTIDFFNGIKFFTSEISSIDFKLNIENDIPFHELMAKVKFTYINKEISQDINPFESLKMPNKISVLNQIYYSQKGDKITTEEFVRQFVLSTFCNFLALEAEGFSDLKINVGGDGSMIVTQEPVTIILKVPASIRSKELQGFIIEVLSNTINCYKNGLLTLEIVNDARLNNNYYNKIAIIKEQKLINIVSPS